MDYCLRNKPTRLFQSPVCGNSFVEEGEECDCGLKEHCDNPCCNPETCLLFHNATCATGKCCDFTTCRPREPGSLCRRADHECDLPEFCDGETESCPDDVHKVDGTSCKVGTAFCYKGSCRTHSEQCKLLWGPSGKKSDNQCYEQNKKGTRHGNCGYNRFNESYIQCHSDDVRCGMLHCQHLNERLEFGTESAAILSHSFINSGGKIIPCRTALVDLGLNDVDPGLAPEGARCGEDSLCVNQKCMPVSRLPIGPLSCPQGCNGHGRCNSKGNCHCDVGFAPPFCLEYGPGGSSDSGPASYPEGSPWTTFFIVLLMLVPLILVISLFIFYRKRKDDWKLLVEKAKPGPLVRNKRSPSRNRLSKTPSQLEISAPMAAVTGDGSALENQQNSQPGSPTALLPRVDTSTSALSATTAMSEQKQQKQRPEDEAGTSSKSRSASLFAGFSKKRIQNLAKSISLPSPKQLRYSASKLQQCKTKAQYEIKVEAQEEPQTPEAVIDHVAVGPPSPEDVVDSANANSKGSSKDSVIFIKEEKVNVQTTVIDGPSPMSASKSLNTFGSRPIRSTMPMSTSFGQDSLRRASATATIITSRASISNSSSSSTSATKPEASTTSPTSTSAKITTATSTSTVSTTTVSKSTTDSSLHYSSDPKLAFPHSSSFAGRAATSSSASTVPSKAAFSASAATTAASKAKSATELKAAKAASTEATTKASASAAKDDEVGVSSNKTSNQQNTTNTPPSASSPPSKSDSVQQGHGKVKKAPPPPPKKPSTLATAVSNKKDVKQVAAATSSSSSSAARSDPKTGLATSSSSATNPSKPTKVTSAASSLNNSEDMPLLAKAGTLPNNVANRDGGDQANGNNNQGRKKSLPKSSTLPIVPTARPVIGKPVLQNATPSAASLISKSHSTGVSQSSILSKDKDKTKESQEFKPRDRSSRGVVFNENLILPSPTNPNNPPIIHIQAKSASLEETSPTQKPAAVSSPIATATATITTVSAASASARSSSPPKAVVVSSVITPTWSTEPKAVTSHIELCHIDDTDSEGGISPGGRGNKDKPATKSQPPLQKVDEAPIASPESEKEPPVTVAAPPVASHAQNSKTNSLSKIKSKLSGGGGVKKEKNKEKRLSKDHSADQIASSASSSVLSSPTSSVRSGHEPPPRPERGHLRKADISGPILLQTNIDPAKAGNLVPVCRSEDVKVSPALSPSHSGRLKAKAPLPPPVASSAASVPAASTARRASADKGDPTTNLLTKKPAGHKSSSSKRPASIATTRPARPSAPPPRPPPQRLELGGSPTKSDTSSLASSVDLSSNHDAKSSVPHSASSSSTTSSYSRPSSISTSSSINSKPTASGSSTTSGAASDVTSPLSMELFDTPLSSPIIARRSPDTLSTASSSDGDLMREILKEMKTEDGGDDTAYSTLVRNKKKNKNKNKN